LVNRQATLGIAVEAIGLLIPYVLVFALPMGMLTATLLVFGRFSADQELTAARAGGISLVSLTTPILLLSLLLCAASAYVNLEVAPRCRVAYKDLIFRYTVNFSAAQLPERRYVRDLDDNFIFYVGRNRNGELQDVLIYQLENQTNATSVFRAPRGQLRVDAEKREVTIELFDVKGMTINGDKFVPYSSSRVPVKLNFDALTKQFKKTSISNLSFDQLCDELRDLENRLTPIAGKAITPEQRREMEKQRATLTEPLRVQLHRQVAFSFACFGFTLIGIPLGIRVHRRETNISFAIALGLVLIYYSFLLVAQALADRPEWSPHLIVWLPNFIFQGVGAFLLWRANRGV
jgi:lipopolysaccharide export system permease protein